MLRPEVIVNCAASIDGKTALPDGKPLSLSTKSDFRRVHELRNSCDAILVGVGTVIADDPSLRVKPEFVKAPRKVLRIVLDSKGMTPKGARVLDGTIPTLVATAKDGSRTEALEDARTRGVDTVEMGEGRVDLKALLEELGRRGLRKVLVEGGGTVVWAFLDAGLVDHLMVFQRNIVVGGKGPSVAAGDGASSEGTTVTMDLVGMENMEDGVLFHYVPRAGKHAREKGEGKGN